MSELSILIDESGSEKGTSKYYIVTLVFHDQSKAIIPKIEKYERVLLEANLPNLPLHTSPLMYGKNPYKHFDIELRKRMLKTFFVFAKNLPITYTSFTYKRQEISEIGKFQERFEKDLTAFLTKHLEFFQRYDKVKVYYDNGQSTITRALDTVFFSFFSKETVIRKIIRPTNYRLAQVADFICAIELSSLKYDAKETTETDKKIFGKARTFRQDFLKHIRRMRLDR